jgi:hypothetical protein
MGGAEDEEPGGPSQDPNREQIRQLVHRRRSGESVADATEIESLPVPDQLQAKDHQQDIDLKKKYADWLLGAVIGQLLLANAVFVTYAWAGERWHLDAVVIDVWLGATLVQVVGVVAIVTRYLFPRRDVGAAVGGA